MSGRIQLHLRLKTQAILLLTFVALSPSVNSQVGVRGIYNHQII